MENKYLNSFQQEMLYGELINAAEDEQIFKLFSMLRPKLSEKDKEWTCNYEDVIIGKGDTPVEAVSKWNQKWYNNES